MMPKITVTRDGDALYTAFEAIFLSSFSAAVRRVGAFSVSLAGGSTPRALYSRLARLEIDWQNVNFFFGDERFVPPDDADSNFRMASETLLKVVACDESQIFRWRTEIGSAVAVADDYEATLSAFFGGLPRFDLCLLGLGADGHTASLFPHSPALGEQNRAAVADFVPKFEAYRLTLTPPALNNSRLAVFIATGAEKAPAVAAVLEGGRRPNELPAQAISPVDGDVEWILDSAAASALQHK